MMSLMGLFSHDDCYRHIDRKSDPLAILNRVIPWEMLRPLLKPVTFENVRGRPSLDALMMVKCLVLQILYNVADGACEYQINDRLSFKRFLGLAMDEKAPDEKSIWLYRERLRDADLYDTVFQWFYEELQKAGYMLQKGQIQDVTLLTAHKSAASYKKQEAVLAIAQGRRDGFC